MNNFATAVIIVKLISACTSLSIDARPREVHSYGKSDDDYFEFDERNNIIKLRWSMIYPGTNWCGTGDTARDYDDLGTEKETDRCCRAHDFCSDFIPAGETKHGLTNKAIHTRLSCDCDDEFRECLHNAGSISSNVVGNIYFDMLGTQCFRKNWYWYDWYDIESYNNKDASWWWF